MKYLPSLLLYFFQNRTTKRNLFLLVKFFIFLFVIVTTYSVIFHILMVYEGRDFSWVTGFYWTLTVMSTLGFGDITFHTDLGLLFTLMVLLSGIVFLLIMLPFVFVQFFYAPWLAAQEKARTPRELLEGTKDHIILTEFNLITTKLIKKFTKFDHEYVIIEADPQKAIELHDMGYRVVVGAPDEPETYERLRIHKAALVVAVGDDLMNTNISFTVREITDNVPIVTCAAEEHSLDILEFPGNTHVFQFMKMLGVAMGQRTLGINTGTTIIGRFGKLLIVDAPAMRTPVEGKSLDELRLREKTGMTVVGFWEHGRYQTPSPQKTIDSTTVLLLAGSEKQLKKYDEHFSLCCADYNIDAPVCILGGGRIGRIVAGTLAAQGIDYTIVEKDLSVIDKIEEKYIHGDGADINTLKKAGIEKARSVIVTTRDDAMNIYLSFYCRKLRPDIQIISRANEEKTVSKLHRAGADVAISYASMGANAILNYLQPDDVSIFTEGLNVFNRKVHSSQIGKNLKENQIRERTGCNVIAIHRNGEQIVSPDPHQPLYEGDELILIGRDDSERRYLDTY